MIQVSVSLQEQAQQIIREEETGARQALSPAVVRKILRYGAIVGSAIHEYDRLERGMERARQLVVESEEKGLSFQSGTLILAHEMTLGRGRFQRQWFAPPGGIWCTLVLVNTLLPENTHLLPLAAGMAACEALCHFAVPAQIKWVNDVHVGNRKIAGILTESFISPRYKEEYVLIGIGMNVNNTVFPEELAETATSMQTVLGREIDVTAVAARLIAKLTWNIGLLHYLEEVRLEANDGLSGPDNRLLMNSWRRLSDTPGRRVLFGYDVQREPQFEAWVVDILDDGALMLEKSDGLRVVERSGEIVYLD